MPSFRLPSRSAIVAGALLALHFGNSGPLNGAAALQQKTPPSQVRPAGWSPATHGNQATPDYARLFALDRVHELRISIDAATFRAMREDLKGVLRYTEAPIVSRDVVGDPASCVFDASLTQADGTMVKVFGWYDNEWGYTNRLVDLTERFAG